MRWLAFVDTAVASIYTAIKLIQCNPRLPMSLECNLSRGWFWERNIRFLRDNAAPRGTLIYFYGNWNWKVRKFQMFYYSKLAFWLFQTNIFSISHNMQDIKSRENFHLLYFSLRLFLGFLSIWLIHGPTWIFKTPGYHHLGAASNQLFIYKI